MFIRFIFNPIEALCFETPDPGSGGAGGITAAPGETVQPTPGEGGDQGGNANFWTLFPDVPEEHKPLIEPHIRRVVGEVTKLNQAHAPFKALGEQNYGAEQIQGLVSFDQRFQQDPIGVFGDMAKLLQDNGIIHDSLDLETVMAIATGQDVPDEPPGEPSGAEGALPDGVREYIGQLEAKIQELDQGFQQDRVQRQERVQNQFLITQMGKMRETLTKAGYPEDLLTDQALNAQILAHQGNVQAAMKTMVDTRTGLLKGFTQQQQEPAELETRNGGPKPPSGQSVSRRDSGDAFAGARASAAARLSRANRDAAQG